MFISGDPSVNPDLELQGSTIVNPHPNYSEVDPDPVLLQDLVPKKKGPPRWYAAGCRPDRNIDRSHI